MLGWKERQRAYGHKDVLVWFTPEAVTALEKLKNYFPGESTAKIVSQAVVNLSKSRATIDNERDGDCDNVSHPSHYTAFPVEVIEIIKAALGPEGFRAYCFGNEIKYRMRAGLKGDNAAEDIAKAMTYKKFRAVS